MKLNILRVSNIISDTSAPYNSFTLFRLKNYQTEQVHYIIYDKIYNFEKISKNFIMHRFDFVQCYKSLFKLIIASFKILIQNKVSLIHGHQPGTSSFVFCIFKIFTNVPIIYNVHNNLKNFTFSKRFFLFVCFSLSDKIVFVSKSASDSFMKEFSFFSKKFLTITNGVDVNRIDRFTANKLQTSNSLGSFKIVCIGRLVEQKNILFLLKVIKNLKFDFELHIFGVGHLESFISNFINSNNLSNKVFLRGNVSREDIYSELLSCSLYVSTAIYEGLPIALLEALYLNCNCVVSNIQSHIEIKNNVNDLVVLDLDERQWEKLITSIYNNPISTNAKNKILSKYSMKCMQHKYTRLYKCLCE